MNSTMLLGMPGGAEWIMVLSVIFIMGILPLIALIDIIRNQFRGSNDKVVWVIVVLFIPLIGSLLYYWIGTEQKVISRG